MTPPNFPTLAGNGFSVHKKPRWSTEVAPHVSGREVRQPYYQYPLWDFELTFEGLTSLASPPTNYANLGSSSLQALLGLFLQCQGRASPFLYADPTDSSVAAQALATGDGVTTTFPFVRSLAGFVEPVGWVTSVANVFLNGVNQASGWSLATPNSLVFGSAPGSGAAISASFAFAFYCRFSEDEVDAEEFMAHLFTVQSLKFQTARY